MAPKAVDAPKRLDRNDRFRGHGPLLQQRGPFPRRAARHRGMYKGPSPCWYYRSDRPPKTTGAPRGARCRFRYCCPDYWLSMTCSSTRRFFALPSALVFGATGLSGP